MRIVRKVIRVGKVAMDVLVTDCVVSDLVLFTDRIPTKSMLMKVARLLHANIDKSLNLGVHADDTNTVRISGEVLNENVLINIRLTSERLLDPELELVPSEDDPMLPLKGMLDDLQSVRRVDWWTKIAMDVYPIMNRIVSLLIWLRSQPNGQPLQCLSEWQLMLVLFFVVASVEREYRMTYLSPGDVVLRLFEALSSGLLLEELRDPSEQKAVNFLADLERQNVEDLMKWSGHCQRLVAFGNIGDIFPLDVNNNVDCDEDGAGGADGVDEAAAVDDDDVVVDAACAPITIDPSESE